MDMRERAAKCKVEGNREYNPGWHTALDLHNVGLGTWPICPCWTDDQNQKHYTAIGHHFGSGAVEYYPVTGISVACWAWTGWRVSIANR